MSKGAGGAICNGAVGLRFLVLLPKTSGEIMADRVKVYEEKKKGIPVWAWLLPLLLLLGLLAFWFTRNRANSTTPTPVSQSKTGAYPALGSIHFATDQATLTPDDQATLDRAAESIKNSPGSHLRGGGLHRQHWI
jgi:hypothetical protein